MPRISNKPTAKQIERKLTKNVRELLKLEDRVDLLPAALDGVRLFNHLFDTTRAAEKVKAPFPGLEVQPVTISGTSKRVHRAMEVAGYIQGAVQMALRKFSPKFEIVVNPMIPLSQIKERRFESVTKDLANKGEGVTL